METITWPNNLIKAGGSGCSTTRFRRWRRQARQGRQASHRHPQIRNHFPLACSLQPQFDVIELLPPAAAEKLRMLRQRAADAHALIPEFETSAKRAWRRIEAENALKRLTNHPQDGGFGLKPDRSPRHRRATNARQGDRRFQAAARVAGGADSGMASGERCAGGRRDMAERRQARPARRSKRLEVEPPKLNKGETVLDAIERLRRRGRELKADLHRIASAPYPSSYAKQRMRAADRGTGDAGCAIGVSADRA